MWAYALLQHLPTVSECAQGIVMCSNILSYQKANGSCSYVGKFSSRNVGQIIHRQTCCHTEIQKLKVTEYLKVYASKG